MVLSCTTPPPELPKSIFCDDLPEYQRTAYVTLSLGEYFFYCLSRSWDKRYRFEHEDLGLVVFDELGKSFVYSTRVYEPQDLDEFRRFIIAWKYLVGKEGK